MVMKVRRIEIVMHDKQKIVRKFNNMVAQASNGAN